MKEKKLFLEIDGYERDLIFVSLNDLRNKLIEEKRSTDYVDDLLLKVNDARKKKSLIAEVNSLEYYR